MPISTEAEIRSIRQVIDGVFQVVLNCPPVAETASPGQFVHIAVSSSDCTDPLLRRPMSICDTDSSLGDMTLLFRVVGRGTRELARRREGETIGLMGPVGRGFRYATQGRWPLLVAGGMGIAPLHFLSKSLRAAGLIPHVLAGFGCAQDVLLTDEFRNHDAVLQVVTEDGTQGFAGRVTDYLDWVTQEMGVQRPGDGVEVYACGPMPMLRSVQEWCLASGAPGQVSLEARMACGTGACLGCAQPVVDPQVGGSYARVCVDGPVFDVWRVDLASS